MGKTPFRKCSACGLDAWTEKDLELFTISYTGRYKRRNKCKKCTSKESNYRVKHPKPKPILLYLRKCRVCGLEAYTEKDLKLFRTRIGCYYGKENICKKCVCSNVDKEYSKKKYLENREEKIKKGRAYRLRVKVLNPKSKYIKQSEDVRKEKARIYRRNHLKEASIEKLGQKIPLDSQCTFCNSTKNLERHHPNYSKPLEVITLCKRCHRRIHAKNKIVA